MGELFFTHHLKCCNNFHGFEISVTKAFKWVVTWHGLRQNSKIDFLVHRHTKLYMGSGGWDPYRVSQPNYFAWFVFYIRNGHCWTDDLRFVNSGLKATKIIGQREALSQIFIVLTMAFHTCLFLPLTTATIIKSLLTCTSTSELFWHFTKELVRNKHATEGLLAKINWLQFGFVGIKNIEANVYEVVTSQQLSFKLFFGLHKSCISNHQKILQQYSVWLL